MRPASIAFPSVQEYCDALQHPNKCFRLPELQESVPDADARGLPMPRTGGVAAVFKMERRSVASALKVFKFGIDQRQQRYQAVSDHLRSVKSTYLVEFTYEEEGIRVPRGAELFGQAQWFPYLRMSWVEGLTLNKWVEQKLARGDRRAIALFAQRFENLVQELKSRGIAHGDLQHGNVLVVNDAPVLVDYDGMYVPSLAGKPAEEFGLPGFQHPMRQQRAWWGPELDDFSAWVIWLTLRAVANDPALWQRHNVAQSETMLFSPRDLAQPRQSRVWPELLGSTDRDVAARADKLLRSLQQPFEVPSFDTDPFRHLRQLCAASPKDHDAIHREATELQRTRNLTPPPELQADVEAARKVVAFRALCQTSPKDHAAIARAFEELQRGGIVLPRDLQTEGEQARLVVQTQAENARLVAQMRTLCAKPAKDWDAIDGSATVLHQRGVTLPNDLQAWANAARGVLELRQLCKAKPRDYGAIDQLAGELKATGVMLAADLQCEANVAAQVTSFVGLCAAMPQDFAAISRAAAALRSALGALPPDLQTLLDDAEQEHKLAAILDELEMLVRSPGDGRKLVQRWAQEQARVGGQPRAAAVQRAAEEWGRRISASDAFLRVVRQPGTETKIAAAWDTLLQAGGHPDAAPHVGRAEEAKKRVTCLKRLAALPQQAEETNDRRWQQTWDDALMRGCPDAAPFITFHAAAKERLRLLAELQQAIENVDRGVGDEQAVLNAAAALPGYVHQYQARVETAHKRLAATQELLRALQASQPSETVIAYFWERLDLPEQKRLTRTQVERCQAALARRECLNQLRAIPPEADEQNDQRWRQTWDESLLRGCVEADDLRPRQAEVAGRLALLAALNKAIQSADAGTGEEKAVVDAAARLPQGYRHRFRTRVEEARKRLVARQALKKALQQPLSDEVIATAWDSMDPAERGRLPAKTIDRCEKAVQCRDCLRQLRAIPGDRPDDEQDSLWLARWKTTLLADCADAEPLRPRYQLARDRTDAWLSLNRCIQNKDLRRIRQLLSENTLLAHYPPVEQCRPVIEDLLRQAAQFDRLEELLSRRLDGMSAADLDFLRHFPAVLESERPRVVQALHEWLSDNPIQEGTTPAEPGCVCWLWPQPTGLVNHCLLAISEKKLQTPEEARENPSVVTSTKYDRFQRTGYPVTPLLPAGRRSAWVTVWAVIDLGEGWERVVGPPLHLDPFRSTPTGRRR